MRRFAVIILALFMTAISAGQVIAADAADRAIIGFSADGRYFAFEEFGIQDGSGFAYANIFVLDLAEDKWVEGSPVRVQKREEIASSLYEARRQALTEAAPLIDRFGTIQPARLLASNAVGEEVADPHTMVFKRYHNLTTLWTVKLTHVDLPLPPHCQSLPSVKGFALSVAVDGKEPVEFYRDKSLPESRGCPESYRLADVISFGEAEKGKAVVLVHRLTFGFEGRDARFMAVPVALPDWR
jgi:predicted secreted protein